MSILSLLIVLFAGLVAGFINAIAGSGSLLTLPALMFGGLDSAVANATNRLGIFVQSIFSLTGYISKGLKPERSALYGVIPVIVGAALGAYLTRFVDRGIFRYIIDAVMLAMLALIFFKPSSWLKQYSAPTPLRNIPLVVVLMFVTGIYAGFLQVGSGYVMMAIMVLVGGMDIYRANTVKVVAQLANAATVIPIYIALDMIDWHLGLVLALGSGVGGWLGARFALRIGSKVVRYVLLIGVVLYIGKEITTQLIAP